MNSTSPRIFPLLKPLSPLVLEPLKAVAQTANALNLPYFLAGATARDLVLENVFGRPPGKLTRDLDFGFVLSASNRARDTRDGRWMAVGMLCRAGESPSAERQSVVRSHSGPLTRIKY